MIPNEILKRHNLRVTKKRETLLALFANAGKAFSHSELQQLLKGEMDRVTLYRMLDDFEKKGILHKIPDDEVSVKYALCDHNHDHEDGHTHSHSDDHPHFKCHDCGETFCLENTQIPAFNAPSGFKVKEQFLLLGGICKQCA